MKVLIEVELKEGQQIPRPEDVARLTSPDWLADWWHIDDIKENASQDITDEEAREVLELASKYRDCNIGLNWDAFTVWTDSVIDERIERYEVMKTSEGYMAYDSETDEYLHNSQGDNCFTTWHEAAALINELLEEGEES